MEEPQTTAGQRRGLAGWVRASDLPLILALASGLTLLLAVVNWHYPISTWLAWRFMWVAGLALLWGGSCLSCGYWLLGKLRLRLETAAAEAVLAFPLGVLAFQIAIFSLGLARLLGVVTFILLPASFAFAGRHKLAHATRGFLRAMAPPDTLPRLCVFLFGMAGLGLLYFEILSPESMHWDARWYHLPIAQQYALQGAIRPFPERWWMAGFPHSASLLYTWAFLLPRALLFDRLELCLHIEFVVFLATIASIPALVRYLVPDVKARGTWAAIFLFPGILLYDSNLCGAADHIAALWAIPLAISLLRLWRNWAVGEAALFGAFVGAVLAAKYSAWSMAIFPGLLFLSRPAWLAVRPSSLRGSGSHPGPILPPFLMGSAAILVVSSQHWLRNWIWYGDPVYPTLHGLFHVQPWSPEASVSYRLLASFGSPSAPTWKSVRDAFQNMFTFAFITNDWPVLHRDTPVFGFLFTLSMLCLPLVRAGARLWMTYVGVLVALLVWYLTLHQDRYLQAWLPIMVVCTMCTLGLVWRRGSLVVRSLVVALVGVQIVWGADVPFFPTHNVTGESPIRLVSSFIASGFLRNPDRLRLFGDEGRIAEVIPPDANLLVHEGNLHVGYGVRTVSDQWQALLSYATLASPARIYEALAALKVTHMVWTSNKLSGWNSLGADLAFMGFALNYAVHPALLGQTILAGFPASAPPSQFNDRVALLGCGHPYPNGFYRIQDLIIPGPGQSGPTPVGPTPDLHTGDLHAVVRDAGFLLVDPGCTPSLPPETASRFHPPVSRASDPLRLYVRRL